MYPDEKLSNCIDINTTHNGPIKAFILSSADAVMLPMFGHPSLYTPMGQKQVTVNYTVA